MLQTSSNSKTNKIFKMIKNSFKLLQVPHWLALLITDAIMLFRLLIMNWLNKNIILILNRELAYHEWRLWTDWWTNWVNTDTLGRCLADRPPRKTEWPNAWLLDDSIAVTHQSSFRFPQQPRIFKNQNNSSLNFICEITELASLASEVFP